MSYVHHQQTGQIVDTEDDQIIATMSESATPEQANLLAASQDLLNACKSWLSDAVDDGTFADKLRNIIASI